MWLDLDSVKGISETTDRCPALFSGSSVVQSPAPKAGDVTRDSGSRRSGLLNCSCDTFAPGSHQLDDDLMERAAEEARAGNLAYISSLPAEDLSRLLQRVDEDGRTLLHAACTSGSLHLVQFLLERGAASAVNQLDEEVSSHTLSDTASALPDFPRSRPPLRPADASAHPRAGPDRLAGLVDAAVCGELRQR